MDDDSKMDESTLEDEEMEEGEASDSEVEVAVEYGVEDSEDQKNSPAVVKKPSRRPTPPYYGPSEDNLLSSSNSVRSGFKSSDAVEVPVKVLNNRAKRFGVKTVATAPTPQKVKNLYDSLGVEHSDFINGWWRGDIIHMYSADPLPTTAVKQYFRNYAPTSISKISEKHSLISWSDSNSPIRALLGLSCAIAYHDDQVDQSRPPTRRHVEPPGSLMVKVENSKSKEVGSKAISTKLKKKKKKKESSDSSDSDSSNDSDSDSSSSDSSSSDSSSDSDSDSSSDSSDSSSSSSSDSDSNESAKKEKKKIKKSKKKLNSKEEIKTTINQPHPEFKDIKIKEESMKAEEIAKVPLSDIPVKNLPDGKWRLGVPFDDTRAILLRFAHASDVTDRRKKSFRMHTFGEKESEWRTKRPRDVDMSDEESENIANDSSRRFAKAARRADKGVKSRLYEVRKFGDGGQARQPDFEPLPAPSGAPPVVDRSYRDLDDPNEEDGGDKNPWGSLARNWGKKETLPVLNYQSMLKNFVAGTKRKRTPEPERMEEDYEHHHRKGMSKRRRDDYEPEPVRRIAPVRRRMESDRRRHDDRQRHREHSERMYSRSHRSDGEEEPLEENEEDSESSEEEVIDWRAKMNLPRMKMYADGEEKRKRKESKKSKSKSVLLPSNSFDSRNKKNIFSRLGVGSSDNDYNYKSDNDYKTHNRTSGSFFRSTQKSSVKSRLG